MKLAILLVLSACLLCSCASLQYFLTNDDAGTSEPAGRYGYDLIRSSFDTANTYGYVSTDRIPRLKIETVDAQPRQVFLDQPVNLVMSYAVLVPAGQLVTISEMRELYFGNARVWISSNSVDRSAGTYRSTVTFQLPANIQKGMYRARFTLQSIPPALAPDIQETSFTVR